jgi:ribosomal protein S18 acetylase RimI-like enzyme
MRTLRRRDTRRTRVILNPRITPKELHSFYVRTGVCEAGYPARKAGRVLTRSDVILAAYRGTNLVGFARGLCDGNSGYITELCVDPSFQSTRLRLSNASVIEKDEKGLGRRLADRLIRELRKQGAQFLSNYIIEGVEEPFYRALGFRENKGHKVYIIDERDYVPRSQRTGRFPRQSARRV